MIAPVPRRRERRIEEEQHIDEAPRRYGRWHRRIGHHVSYRHICQQVATDDRYDTPR